MHLPVQIPMTDEEYYLLKEWRHRHPSFKLSGVIKELLFDYIKTKEHIIKNRQTHFLTYKEEIKNA